MLAQVLNIIPFIILFLIKDTNSAQDCVPGEWSSWSICDMDCGPLGTRKRERSIKALPSADGLQCSEFRFSDEEPCNRFCYNGGEVGIKECFCKKGYQGACCELDVDECKVANGGCQQQCTNRDGGFDCSCWDGFKKNDVNGRCEDVDECSDNGGGCDDTCINFAGGYACACIPPKILEMDGKACSKENYCLTKSDKHNCSEHCVIHHNAFMCNCPEGTKLDTATQTCIDIDECSTGDYCEGGLCFNFHGSFRCECGVGKGLDPSGKKCIDVDECKPGMNQCSHTCKNVNAGHVCLCPAGLIIGKDHRTCEDEDECKREDPPCSHGCQNVDASQGGYVCSCPPNMELEHDNKTCCEIGKCSNPLSASEGLSKSVKLIVGFSVTAVVLVIILVIFIWRILRRSIATNEKVIREIQHAPDVFYNRGAELEMESRDMSIAETTNSNQHINHRKAPKSEYKTF